METLAKREEGVPAEYSVAQVRAQVNKIQEIMRDVMKDEEHFGVIPGTQKPTLYKAGAEKLLFTFRMDPQYDATREYDGDHLTVTSLCTLYHIPTGNRLGSGMGSCSTKESKYAYRHGSRKCPNCGKEAIIKGKEEYGGGYVCFKKKDGCGEKFSDNDPAMTGQIAGRVPNEDLPDQYNTVLKMSNKRALVASVLNVTAASDIFTQDLEETGNNTPEPPPAQTPAKPTKPPKANQPVLEAPLRLPDNAPEWMTAFKDACLGMMGEIELIAALGAAGYSSIGEVPSKDVALKIHKALTMGKGK